MKFDGAAPVRSIELFMIMFSSTLRDHPYSTAAAVYQSRAEGVSDLSMIVRIWPHGNCATACGAIGPAPHCRTKVIMYCRFRGENPFMSGNSARRSSASRLMTLLPQPC